MEHKRIPARTVRAMCGDVSDMWLWRRLNDPAMGFPRPVYIAKRRYWREADIVEWLESRETEAA